MPAETPNFSLGYPVIADPVAAHTDLKRLAEDTDAALKAVQDVVDPLHTVWSEVVPWTNLSIGGPFSAVGGFTPQFCVLGPLVFVRGMVFFTGSTFYGANMCWVPSAYGPGATQHHVTTKIQSISTVVQLQVSAAGAVSCAGSPYLWGTVPAPTNAISVTGSWVRQGVL